MQSNAAVFRTGETLQEGKKLIDDCYQSMKDLKVTDKVCEKKTKSIIQNQI